MKRYQKQFSESQLKAYCDHWLKIGRSTDPIDKAKVEQGIALAYCETGLAPPNKIIYRDSPYQGFLEVIRLLTTRRLAEQAGKPVCERVWHNVRGHVWTQVWNLSFNHVVEQVLNHVRIHIRSPINDQIWWWLRNELDKLICDYANNNDLHPAVNVANVWDSAFCAGHEAPTIAQLTIFKDIPEVARLNGLVQIAENAGWCFLFENLAIVTPRPSQLLWRKVLYRKDKCVHIEYPDGWAVSELSPLERLAAC